MRTRKAKEAPVWQLACEKCGCLLSLYVVADDLTAVTLWQRREACPCGVTFRGVNVGLEPENP